MTAPAASDGVLDPSDAAVRAVSLDIWLTLVRSHPDFKAHRNELLRTGLGLRTDPAEFAAALRAADQRADVLSEASGRDHALADRLALVLDDLGEPRELAAPELVTSLLDAQHALALSMPPVPLHPDVPALLAELATVVPVGVTSNTGMIPGRTMRALLDASGLLAPLSVRTFSDEVGVAKPAPAIFTETVARFAALLPGLVPGEVVHVGDNPVADVDGALASGLRPLLVGPGLGTDDALRALAVAARRAAA